MPDKKPPDPNDEKVEKPCLSRSFPLKPGGEVVLTQHDAPPPSGKQRIHQRRPLPQVPEKRQDEQSQEDQGSQDPNHR